MREAVVIRTVFAAVACALCAFAFADSTRKIDIPAGELTTALRSLADQSGAEFVYSADLLKGVRTQGVHGEYATETALTQLLLNTNLAASARASGAFLIARANANFLLASDEKKGPHRARGEGSREEEDESAEDQERKSFRDRAHQDEKNQSVKLEEVVVTAQKREEYLQKAPLQVIAVTGEALQRAGITDAQGLTDVVPGLEVGNLGSTTTFTIRGVTSNTDPNLGDSPTAFHIDGIYQGRPAAASGLFYDVSRVEVLSGPQGTLYGKDSTGGTINVITNKPDFHGDSAEFTQEFGSYYLYRTFGMVNVPVDPELAFRVAFQTQKHTGYLATGYSDADDIAGRVHLLWRPTEDFTALLTQDYFHQGGIGNGQIPIPQPGDYWASNPWSVKDTELQLEGATGFGGRTNNVSMQTSLLLDWNTGIGKLSSVSAYHHLHLDATSFLNGTPSLQQETDSEISQEIRLASPDGAKTKWVLGAYYHREQQTNNLYFYNQAGPGTDSVQLFPKIETPSYALFGQATYPIRPSLRVTVGLRGNVDKKTVNGTIVQAAYPVDFTQNPPAVDRTAVPVITPQASPNGSLTARRLTWRFGMDKDLTDNSLLFFNVSTGYKQGGLDAAQPPNNIYRPETIKAYEIGSKNRFLNDRLQVNLDAYLYDYKNYQVDQLEYFPGENGPVFGDFISNAANARHKGVELGIDAVLTRHDTLSLNVSYLSAVFQSFQYPAPVDPAAPPQPNFSYEDLSGYTEFSAPRWTGTLTYQHTWEMPHDGQLSLRAQSHGESYYWLTPDHRLDSRQPGYSRSQLALQYSGLAGKYTVQAYVHNLENRAVYNNYTFQGPPPAHNYATLGPPRTYGMTLQVRF
jgi:iron complex outermembrane receptor protein